MAGYDPGGGEAVLPRFAAVLAAAPEGAEDVLHDAAVPEVGGLAGGVDADHGPELAAVGGHGDLLRNVARADLLDAGDVERLAAGQPQRLDGLPRAELKRQHPHADQVGPVDPLERLGQDGPDAEQRRALGGPVAGRPGAVLLAAQHDQRRALLDVPAGRVVDAHLLVFGQLGGDAALGAGREQVAQPDVRERAADHHLVVAAAGAVGVEVAALDAVLGQVPPGRAVRLDRAGRRDVVGGHRVAEQGERAGPVDVFDRLRLGVHAVEVRRAAHVGRLLRPGERVAGRHLETLPALVALEHVRVVAGEHLGGHGVLDDLGDLARRRPDVVQVDRLALGVRA